MIPLLDKDTKIMVISTTCLEVPPPHYGGLEQMVYNLAHELGQRGYDVSCVAPQGTEIENVEIIETIEPDDSQNCFAREPEAFDIYGAYLPNEDIIIDHSWQKLSYIGKANNQDLMEDTTILGVWHGMPSIDEKPPVVNANFLSVSKSAAKAWEEHLGFTVKHVYNGIDFDRYEFNEDKEDFFITLNRIMSEKGIKKAIHIANEADVNLKIVGEDQFVDDPGYVHEVMKLAAESDNIRYRGTVDESEKIKLLSKAKGMLLLPQHPYKEVFGLAAVEAFASGTPVIATDNNGLSEVVRTVQEGLVSNDIDELVDYVRRVDANGLPIIANNNDAIHRFDLRERAYNNFSKEKMADIYLKRAEEALEAPW